MLRGFHVLAGLSIKLQPEKRYSRLAVGWNVWEFHELGLFWRVPQSNYNRKKGTVVWSLVATFGGFHELGLFGRFVAMFYGGLLDQITNYDQKKKLQLSGHRLEINTESEYNSKLQIRMALPIK
jgi:hypothetical protein